MSIESFEDALAEIKILQQWVSDLQGNQYVNCVYCGHRYGPSRCLHCGGSGFQALQPDHMPDVLCKACKGTGTGVPVSQADRLSEHIAECPKHPMSALKEKLIHIGTIARLALEQPLGDLLQLLEEIISSANLNLKTSPGIWHL